MIPDIANQKGAAVKKPEPVPRKPQKESLLEQNRSQNVAIARKKLTFSSDEIRHAITV